jgi:hypothetical protein
VHADTLAVLDCFLITGILGVYLKFALLGPQWVAVARFLGESSPDALAWTTRAGLFAHDLWLNLLVIPIAGTAVVAAVFRRKRVAAGFVISLLLSAAYYIELQVQKEVGDYLSRAIARDLVGWTISASSSALDYVTPASLAKFAGVCAALAAVVVVARLSAGVAGKANRTAAVYYRLLAVPAAAVMLLAIVSLPVAFASPLARTELSRSALARAAGMLTGGRVDRSGPAFGDADGALEAFRQLTHTAPIDVAHEYVGREHQSDVIVFMMETGAAHALDLAAEGARLAGTGQLYGRSFVASRHYTSHPYSSDALYSVFSGRYPQGRRRLLRAIGRSPVTGLMTSFGSEAMRRVYVPSLYHIELDDRMYAAFGAETVYASDEVADEPLRAAAEARSARFIQDLETQGSIFDRRSRARLRTRLRADLQALERLKRDVSDAIRGGRRYAVMLFPEIGHGPWMALRNESSVLARGRSLMLLQDEWLKEIVDLLRQHGRLDQTVIVVTGDHGVRTRAEDPSLRVGTISDYMFRVPLMVYAPQTLTTTVAIDTPTSHIDLAPTILALAGRVREASRMQGTPIWQRTPRDRIYLLAFDYGGAEGFVDNGAYYMRQGMSGAISASPEFRFDDIHQLAPSDPRTADVSSGLTQLEALQQARPSGTSSRSSRCCMSFSFPALRVARRITARSPAPRAATGTARGSPRPRGRAAGPAPRARTAPPRRCPAPRRACRSRSSPRSCRPRRPSPRRTRGRAAAGRRRCPPRPRPPARRRSASPRAGRRAPAATARPAPARSMPR